ncbi:MAG: hypothetical protein KIG68_00305 [Oxalobacter sp.]|nr:hypothetical protein [Oxalobacter sp.]
MEQLFYTLSGFSEKSGINIDNLLIMGRMGQIAFCIDIDPYNGDWQKGTISIDDEEFNSLPNEPEETIPENVLDALFPNLKEAAEEFEKLLKERQEKNQPIYERIAPQTKRLLLPTSITTISGKWYIKNLKTDETKREDVRPKLHNPNGYGCYKLTGLYQIPNRCINRKKKTYATNVIFPYGRTDLGIELENIENPKALFPVLSGSLDELVIPAEELEKLMVDSLAPQNRRGLQQIKLVAYKEYSELVKEFFDLGHHKIPGERTIFQNYAMKKCDISKRTEERYYAKAKKDFRIS